MTRVLANVKHEGSSNEKGEVELYRQTNDVVTIRMSDNEGDEVAIAFMEPRAFAALMEEFENEEPRPPMGRKEFALKFSIRAFKPGWTYPMYQYFKGELSLHDVIDELGITPEEFEKHLAGLFYLGVSTCPDGAEHASIKEV